MPTCASQGCTPSRLAPQRQAQRAKGAAGAQGNAGGDAVIVLGGERGPEGN